MINLEGLDDADLRRQILIFFKGTALKLDIDQNLIGRTTTDWILLICTMYFFLLTEDGMFCLHLRHGVTGSWHPHPAHVQPSLYSHVSFSLCPLGSLMLDLRWQEEEQNLFYLWDIFVWGMNRANACKLQCVNSICRTSVVKKFYFLVAWNKSH